MLSIPRYSTTPEPVVLTYKQETNFGEQANLGLLSTENDTPQEVDEDQSDVAKNDLVTVPRIGTKEDQGVAKNDLAFTVTRIGTKKILGQL